MPCSTRPARAAPGALPHDFDIRWKTVYNYFSAWAADSTWDHLVTALRIRIGHAANVHLDLATPNFGIQEGRLFTQAEKDGFPGCPELKNGYFYANNKPGLGIDLDEKLAAKFPINDDPPFDMYWGNTRKRDGTIVKP